MFIADWYIGHVYKMFIRIIHSFQNRANNIIMGSMKYACVFIYAYT